MRLIFWLAAGLSAAAIATAAPARPGGGGPGHGSGLQVGWQNGGGHHGFKGGRTRFGIGRIEIERRHGRHRGRSGRYREEDFNVYGGIGIAGSVGEFDPYGNGFFTGSGGRISLRGGRPYYDYDRSYPYEWAAASGGRHAGVAAEEEEARLADRPGRCTMENGVRVCRGW